MPGFLGTRACGWHDAAHTVCDAPNCLARLVRERATAAYRHRPDCECAECWPVVYASGGVPL